MRQNNDSADGEEILDLRNLGTPKNLVRSPHQTWLSAKAAKQCSCVISRMYIAGMSSPFFSLLA
jgi:hypothetical protein